MKNIINKIKLSFAVLATAGVSSCSLDMLPLNEVVLDNFWTDKADVESVVASCYQATKEGGYISDIIVWGETRSDNLDIGTDIPAALNSLMRGSLKTTNSYCNWSAMYNVINRCNTVIHYAPEVAGKDPNYTPSDLNATIAECSFLRAYSYLTLIKTFKNVPFTLDPTIDDAIDYQLPQTSFEDVLDALIRDIESCKDYAPRKYSEAEYNTGKVTRAAMYSLLAELYLWRASDAQLPIDQRKEYYTKCIQACDWVLNYKIQQYLAKDFYGQKLESQFDNKVWTIFGYPLLQMPDGAMSLFGTCNAIESIFEIPFRYRSETSNNGDVAAMYGTVETNGKLTRYVRGSSELMSKAPTSTSYNDENLFSVPTDYRSLLSFVWEDGNSFAISKYVTNSFYIDYTGNGTITSDTYTNASKNPFSLRQTNYHYESWIIYRLAEVMLFRAEAEIELAALIDANAVPTSDTKSYRDGASLVGSAPALYEDAYNLITAVYLRSNPFSFSSTGSPNANYAPKIESYKTQPAVSLRKYLMNERRREFLFEGKRYYDLVRQARRVGNTDDFSSILSSKYSEGSASSLKMKMKMMDFMYMPILKSQIQVNPNLVQNPAYADEEETVKN